MSSSLYANSVAFTNFSIDEDNDTSIQFKNSGSVVAEINGAGIVYDNTTSGLTATTMNAAVDEVYSLGGETVKGKNIPALPGDDTDGYALDYDSNTQTLQWISEVEVGGSKDTSVSTSSLRFLYRFSSSTGDSDPGDGKIRLNNGTYASVTEIYIDNKEYAKKTNIRNLLLLATGEINIYVQKSSDNSKWVLFSADGIDSTDSGYIKFQNVTMLQESGSSLTDGKDVLVVIAKKIGTEVRGVEIPSLPSNDTDGYGLDYDSNTQTFSWSSTTEVEGSTLTSVSSGSIKMLYKWKSSTSDSDPGDGKLNFNNGTYASVTKIYIDNKEYAKKTDIRNILLLATGDINIYVQDKKDNQKYALFTANGIDSTDSGYLKFENVSLVQAGTSLSNDKEVLLVVAKRPGKQIQGITVPALPSDDTGDYAIHYDSENQALAWQSQTQLLENTTITTVSGTDTTYTAAQLLGGVIHREMDSASRTDTTPTAAQIVTELNNNYNLVDAGATFHCTVHCDDNHTLTISAGSGVTLHGDTSVSKETCITLRVICTNITASSEAVIIYITGV